MNSTNLLGYNNIHENLAKIELEALTLLEVVQSSEGGVSGKVEKEGDKIAALEISENLLWLQVIYSIPQKSLRVCQILWFFY